MCLLAGLIHVTTFTKTSLSENYKNPNTSPNAQLYLYAYQRHSSRSLFPWLKKNFLKKKLWNNTACWFFPST